MFHYPLFSFQLVKLNLEMLKLHFRTKQILEMMLVKFSKTRNIKKMLVKFSIFFKNTKNSLLLLCFRLKFLDIFQINAGNA